MNNTAELLDEMKDANQRMLYSATRFDTLKIAISGGGLYTCFEFFKMFYSRDQLFFKTPLLVAATLLTGAIVVNFLSQDISFKANKARHHELGYRLDMQKDHDRANLAFYTGKISEYSAEVKRYNKNVTNYNLASTLLMAAGLIFILIFCLLQF